MEFKDITTWSVSKGVATPVNPHCPDITFSTSIVVKSKLFAQFDGAVKELTFATDAPDGSYSADRFGKIVWRFMNVKFEWINCVSNDPSFSKSHGFSTRQFLPFIYQVKEAEIITLDINDFSISIQDIERAFCYGYLANPESDCLDSAEMMRRYELFKTNYLTPMLSRKGIID